MKVIVVGAFLLLLGAVAWKIYQLWRAPHDLALRAVTLCLLCYALAFPMQFNLVAVEATVDAALGSGVGLLIQNLTSLLGLYWLVVFFLYSAGASRRRVRWETGLLVAAVVCVTLAVIATPVHLRGDELAAGDPAIAPVVLFLHLSAAPYFAYTLGAAAVWSWRYADETASVDRQLAAGLRMTSAGLALGVLGVATSTIFVATRRPGAPFSDWLDDAGRYVIAVGIVLLMIGVSYPGIRTRIAAIRRWARHRRVHDQLRPLWMLLHHAYPANALHRMPTGPTRDLLAFRKVHRRYYRRVIECRDGLVRLGPYLAHAGMRDNTEARVLCEALDMQARGESVRDTPVRVAIPSGAGLDADVAELVRLSQSIRTG